MTSFHFLRPWLLLGFIPTFYLAAKVWHYRPTSQAWAKVCDEHLLRALMSEQSVKQRQSLSLWMLILGLFFLWFAASGPAWKKYPIPIFAHTAPKVLLLDISSNMLAADLTPNRLQRAKFLTQDLLNHKRTPPIGMIAYTQEPFLLSPITQDTHTISTLLPNLTTQTAPVDGENLNEALTEAAKLISAHYHQGSVLVMTGSSPDTLALNQAKRLHEKGLNLSIIYLSRANQLPSAFTQFAQLGGGKAYTYTDFAKNISKWLRFSNRNQAIKQAKLGNIPQWQDEGRWFILPALLLMLPFFQRGRLRSMLG